MTEAMQKHYEKKYGIRTDLLPHCIPEQDYLRAPAEMRRPKMAKPTVLFVGGVQDAHESGFTQNTGECLRAFAFRI